MLSTIPSPAPSTVVLHSTSSDAWLEAVLQDFDTFLLDHAANEKKASGFALNFAAHYPDKHDFVAAMIDLAIEELSHYREVFKLIRQHHIPPVPDCKDVYVNRLRKLVRDGSECYFLDRLLVAAIIEARGLERFQRIAAALPLGPLKTLYETIYRSEARHSSLFLDFAYQYCQGDSGQGNDEQGDHGQGDHDQGHAIASPRTDHAHNSALTISTRLTELLDAEAQILADLPIRPILH